MRNRFGAALSFLVAMVFVAEARAWAVTVTIETHMEYTEEERDEKWMYKQCEKVDAQCTQEYNGELFIQPKYPMKWLNKGMQAVCVASLSIDVEGKVSSINEIICKPNIEDFKNSIEEVVSEFKFVPRVVDGVPEAVGNALLKFNFKIEL
ncbi:energy transducer TonB [Pseudoteredinibacter isoporae]|uniref:TonB C-terminal domain-containing protein n=1 Tax=Pseudoteredinibacter isoporae TaxID=570281 RepID=A0A7X0JUY0_9GAMM|nr:energy transducer TonB [Pseudoteredinibacter isoporae]MBB6521781.1 hypothetical protein [Pseudoteredinibacter isoporae]NHO87327.1 hypothetical protein [Pseudoteredinibacter isoporae]NIB23041.1 hypothetical protein [Pseudoteredinibacter isoporae]